MYGMEKMGGSMLGSEYRWEVKIQAPRVGPVGREGRGGGEKKGGKVWEGVG